MVFQESFSRLRSRGGHGLPRSAISVPGLPPRRLPRPAVKFALGGSPPFAIVELMHHKPLTMHAGFAIKKVSPVSDRAVATACPL